MLRKGAKVVAETPFGPGNTSKNLELAIMDEEFEVNEMYPAYIEVARLQGDKTAETNFRWAQEAEKIHAELFRETKKYADQGKDWPIDGYIWTCPVCGYTYIGKEPPEKSPICGALGRMFVQF